MSAKDHSKLQATVNTTDLDEMIKRFQPLMDFEQESISSRKDNLRMLWDIRIVQGEDTPFASTKGSSSMPCALISNMVANTPGLIHREIFEKILIPLVSAVRDKIGLLTAESLRPKENAEAPPATSPRIPGASATSASCAAASALCPETTSSRSCERFATWGPSASRSSDKPSMKQTE